MNTVYDNLVFQKENTKVIFYGFVPVSRETKAENIPSALKAYTDDTSIDTDFIPLSDLRKFQNSDLVRDTDITARVKEIEYNNSLEAPYGNATINLEMSLHEALRLLHGRPVESASFSAEVKGVIPDSERVSRYIKTGGWLAIYEKETCTFFGVITNIFTELAVNNGIRQNNVTLTCNNFMYPLFNSEIKQTLSKDVSVKDVNPACIFTIADYSQGFLAVIKDTFKIKGADNPAEVLQDVIRAIVHQKLPVNVTGVSNARLGDYIHVYDGSYASMYDSFFYGSDADVIKGVPLSYFASTSANNITQFQLLAQMFSFSPDLIEMFAFIQPLAVDARTNVLEKVLGARLCFMYRFKPAYPLYPPTKAGLERYRLKNEGVPAVVEPTISESYFGDFKRSKLPSAEPTHYILSTLCLIEFTINYSESEHVNAVFVEQAFTSGNAHLQNFFRKDARPVLNVKDINRHGLRAMSFHTPFVSNKEDSADIKTRNRNSANALAERLFHNVGNNNEFCTGILTFIDNGELSKDTLFFEGCMIGEWIEINLGADDFFTAYIMGATVNMSRDDNKSVRTITLEYERGSFNGNVAVFTPSQFIEETVKEARKANNFLTVTLGDE